MDRQSLLEQELRGSINFMLDYTNLNPRSPGFGLTVDATKDLRIASIAATGFALSGWVIACERGWLTRQRALEITRGTLRTLLQQVPHQHGFFAHFLDMETAERWGKCEYSTIDTALCLNGVLNGVITAAAYFRDNEVQELADAILKRVDWPFIIFEDAGQSLFYMAYNPDREGDYVEGEPGYISRWDMAAEQKMMYLQAAGQIEPTLARRLYAGFRRDKRIFNAQEVIVNPGGNLFAYQFSEAWLDTASYLDPDGIDWFENTRRASLAHRQFAIDQSSQFKTYGANSWGSSAGDRAAQAIVHGATMSLAHRQRSWKSNPTERYPFMEPYHHSPLSRSRLWRCLSICIENIRKPGANTVSSIRTIWMSIHPGIAAHSTASTKAVRCLWLKTTSPG